MDMANTNYDVLPIFGLIFSFMLEAALCLTVQKQKRGQTKKPNCHLMKRGKDLAGWVVTKLGGAGAFCGITKVQFQIVRFLHTQSGKWTSKKISERFNDTVKRCTSW